MRLNKQLRQTSRDHHAVRKKARAPLRSFSFSSTVVAIGITLLNSKRSVSKWRDSVCLSVSVLQTDRVTSITTSPLPSSSSSSSSSPRRAKQFECSSVIASLSALVVGVVVVVAVVKSRRRVRGVRGPPPQGKYGFGSEKLYRCLDSVRKVEVSSRTVTSDKLSFITHREICGISIFRTISKFAPSVLVPTACVLMESERQSRNDFFLIQYSALCMK